MASVKVISATDAKDLELKINEVTNGARGLSDIKITSVKNNEFATELIAVVIFND